jgi:hypothetical protein
MRGIYGTKTYKIWNVGAHTRVLLWGTHTLRHGMYSAQAGCEGAHKSEGDTCSICSDTCFFGVWYPLNKIIVLRDLRVVRRCDEVFFASPVNG